MKHGHTGDEKPGDTPKNPKGAPSVKKGADYSGTKHIKAGAREVTVKTCRTGTNLRRPPYITPLYLKEQIQTNKNKRLLHEQSSPRRRLCSSAFTLFRRKRVRRGDSSLGWSSARACEAFRMGSSGDNDRTVVWPVNAAVMGAFVSYRSAGVTTRCT